MQLIQAEVKYPGRVCNTKFGECQNTVFISPKGDEIPVWAPTSYAPLTSLKRAIAALLAL